jgi:beta-lactamase class D
MPKRALAVLIPISLVFFSAAPRPPALPADAGERVARVLAGTESAFVLYDQAHDRYVRFDEARCRERFTPFSTFKIPNSAIGLETGVIQNPDALVRWDQAKHPPQSHWPEAWRRDHSLRSAFKASTVWFYQDMAVRIGPERMAKHVRQFGYGNQDTSGGIDQFWLASSLKISADEQVRFLRSFHAGKLGLSPRTTATVKDIMVQEKTPAFTLSAKTGGGPKSPDKGLGWYVGYVETRGNVYFFALNTDGPSYDAIKDKRIDLTKAALRAAGVLPPP